MMDVKMWNSGITRAELSNSINKLQGVRRVPESPQENPMMSSLLGSSRRLSIEREQEIACNLSFIAAVSNNPLRVMAVCVEEHFSGEEITIRLASNTGELVEITNGFKDLATVMMGAARRERSRAEDTNALFRQIVKLDIPRILSRLRSRHGKSKPGQPPIINQLIDALGDILKDTTSRSGNMDLDLLETGATDLRLTFAKLEGLSVENARTSDGIDFAMKIIKQAYGIAQIETLDSILKKSVLNPVLASHISESISKLGKYYSAARELICAARDKTSRLFRTIHIEPFQIVVPPTIQARIHAEIQLLFFYETHPNQDRPRIISSSKSACYLCNLFFKIHRGFQVPRTHGRLYERWALPDWLEVGSDRKQHLTACLKELKGILDERILMASRMPRPKQIDPKESIVLQFADWPSSAATSRISNASHASNSTLRPSFPIQYKHQPKSVNAPGYSPLTPPESPSESNLPKILEESPLNVPAPSNLSKHDAQRSSASISSIISTITVGRKELPYRMPITLDSPSMNLGLDELFITFDFEDIRSGQIVIEEVAEVSMFQKACHNIDIEDIPTATELQLDGPHDLSRVSFQLKRASREYVCITFVWDKVETDKLQ